MLDSAVRRDMLMRYFAVHSTLLDIGPSVDGAEGDELDRLSELELELLEREDALRESYAQALESRWVSRCPFTDRIVEIPIDTNGLDGLWWRYDAPTRPPARFLRTQLAFTGALRLEGPPEWSPFLAMPGPEAPYVIPRLLELEGVKAVLAEIPIGRHHGYAITYFADPLPESVARSNDWGTDRYWWFDKEGRHWDEEVEDVEEFDFDLAPWVGRGKLLWIEPGLMLPVLREGVDGCPFLEVGGRRELVRVQEGQVW